LMAKNPDERYQSCQALEADLRKWLKQFADSSISPVFDPVFSADTGILQIPAKVYGRKSETLVLSAACDRIGKKGKEFVIISGAAGLGKTVLVQSMQKSFSDQGGFFISGKFDQFQNDLSTSGVLYAFRNLMDELLAGDEYQFKQWKKRINETLGENIGLLLDVIPELEAIKDSSILNIGLKDEEKKQVFPLVFQKFVSIFARKNLPLILFIDDLQWATPASLELILLIAGSELIEHILIIGAFRENEVDTSHPLWSMLEKISKDSLKVSKIILTPLEYSDIHRLVAETVRHGQDQCKSLAESVAANTMGNPFFIKEFLTSIYKKNFLWFDFKIQQWEWYIKAIRKLKVSDKVVPLVIERILILKEDTQRLLQFAACIGGTFEAATLALISKTKIDHTITLLKEAVQEGLIISQKREGWYEFPHDRIQQAAYTMMKLPERTRYHYYIGRRLLEGTNPLQIEENIIGIANQLNSGIEFISSDQEKKELVELNLLAGKRAKSVFAYAQALDYFELAISLYEKWCREKCGIDHNSCWQIDYRFTLDLYEQAVEAAFLAGDYGKLDSLLLIARDNIIAPIDEVKFVTIGIKKLHGQNKLLEAVYEAVDFCKKFGFIMPKKPNKMHVILGYLKTRMALSSRSVAGLADLPEMTDPEMLAVFNTLSNATMAAYATLPNMVPLIVFTGINMSLKYGNCPNSIFGYAGYGLFLCNIIGDYKKGSEYGKLAMELLNTMDARIMKARTIATVYGFVLHWQCHNREMLSPLQDGFKGGLNTGDYQYACNCAFQVCKNYFLTGEKLDKVEQELFRVLNNTRQLHQDVEYRYTRILGHMVSRLTGNKNSFSLAYTFSADRDNRLFLLREAFCNMVISYIFNQPARAIEHAEKGRHYAPLTGSMLATDVNLNFYHSLALLGEKKNMTWWSEIKRNKKVISNQKQLKKWAAAGPMNHGHKYKLVKAEFFRIKGEPAKAEIFYKQAIIGARTNSYIHEEALANELASRFYRQNNNHQEAKISMMRAHHCYYQWGAMAKVRDLEKHYPDLLFSDFSKKEGPRTSAAFSNPASILTRKGLTEFDWLSVFKLSQALSSEILMDKLLDKMMRLVLENSGAGYGCLILMPDNKPVIKSEMRLAGAKLPILQNTPVYESSHLPLTIINYVIRTLKPVLCDNIALHDKYGSDPYIRSHNPRSVLSLPIILKSELFGLLYLENRLTTGTFTEQHLDVLTMLSTQIAISLENATLFAENEQRSKKQIEQEKQISREKEHIIQDLHDGIGGSLVHIKILSEMIRDNAAKQDQQNKASLVAELADESLTELKGLFRSLDPARADWDSVISDISHYGNRILEEHNIEFEMNTRINNPPKFPDGLFSLLLFNIYRESLNNIIKHSKARLVTIEVILEPDKMSLKIRDNGIGFKTKPESGRGLGIMKKRAGEMGADITINGNDGVTISLSLPLST